MSEKITVERALLVQIHNAVSQMHPTGEDIITAAEIMMRLRQELEEEQEDESNG